jgi:glutathione S-transferase
MAEPATGIIRVLDVATSIGTTLVRAGAGASVGTLGARPTRTLEIWDFEGCPYCRKAREALSVLDLDAVVHPCPKNGPRLRPQLVERGGKAQFPYLVDPNTGKEMYESDDIVRYLFATYGDGRIPFTLTAGPLTDVGSALAGLFRPGLGSFYEASSPPELLLELWSFEASPFCRIVREKLTTLELPYLLHNVAAGSPRRAAFARRSGKMQVPYLVDPNTGVEMFESAEIVAYLEERYSARA